MKYLLTVIYVIGIAVSAPLAWLGSALVDIGRPAGTLAVAGGMLPGVLLGLGSLSLLMRLWIQGPTRKKAYLVLRIMVYIVIAGTLVYNAKYLF